ncbi:response regulator [Hoeflea prorocentri]|uniref:Response regulator transcription factor n=1 Tax=Hoeflea prorocentri TaxID=1922333 RepID=A0A9X3ZGT0_9HYPH|nr:response regulator transcription factor [Hoeflea prorocentri]MCY6380131.1 response regulator transcription factor [Hoeflea prorocentri]MDA5397931.1 response regulator transcription factor [Hoeflea prorocentri]
MRSGPSDGNRVRLVIVDDHDLVREGIRSRLTDADFVEVVGEGSNGTQAVELCEMLGPDLVLLDISMPEMNGLEAARRIKQSRPNTKILFLSIYDNEEYVQEALRVGANGFVLKDVSKDEMINAIRSVAQGATYLGPQAAASLAGRNSNRLVPANDFGLTEREKQVLSAVSKGLTNRQIAEQLNISVRTVESHRLSIREKTGGGNAVALSKIANRLGL